MKQFIAKKKDVLIILILLFLIYICYKLSIPIPCPFKTITGLDCPGCGITRMIISITEFKFYEAFMYNQFCFILLILGIIYGIIKIFIKKDYKIPDSITYTLIIISILFAIWRNLINII